MNYNIHTKDGFIKKGIEHILHYDPVLTGLYSDATIDIYIISDCYELLRWGKWDSLMRHKHVIIMGNESVMRTFENVFDYHHVRTLDCRCSKENLIRLVFNMAMGMESPVLKKTQLQLTSLELSVLWKLNNYTSNLRLSKYDSAIKRRAMTKLNVKNNVELYIKFTMLLKVYKLRNYRLVRQKK